MKTVFGKITAGILALALLLGAFGVFTQPAKAILTLAVRNVADTQAGLYSQSLASGDTAADIHRFLVKVEDDGITANATTGAANDTITITVKNVTRGVTGAFTIIESGVEAHWSMYVEIHEVAGANDVPAGTANTSAKIIPGFEADEITVSYTPFSKSVIVDNIGPVISNSTPASAGVSKVGPITFSADITDTGSGFTTSSSSIDNFAAEHGQLSVTLLEAIINKTDLTYTKIDDGWNISLTTSLGASGASTPVPWRITAVDRAGNSKDLVRESATSQLTVDGAKPVMKATNTRSSVDLQARTGAKWDGSKTGIEDPAANHPNLDSNRARFGSAAGSKGILVLFDEAGGLDVDSVDPTDFIVDGEAPASVLVVDILEDSEVTPSSIGRRPQEVYLTMGSNIVSNKKPKVTLSGSIKDVAGNSADSVTITVADGLPPKFTVSLNRTYDDKDVTITVTADETLLAAPVLFLDRQTSTTSVTGAATRPGLTATGALSYEKKAGGTETPGGNVAKKVLVKVTGSDASPLANVGSKGSTDPSSSSAISFQLDNELNNSFDPEFTVAGTKILPNGNKQTATGTDSATAAEIEAVDPLLITIGFDRQCGTDAAGGGGVECGSGGEKTEYSGDTHKTVELTKTEVKVTLSDGSSQTLSPTVSTTDSIVYTVAIGNAPTGDYKITLNGKDEAGNTSTVPGALVATEIDVEFAIIAAKPVELGLNPGWNLVSLPFQPSNPSVNSVIAADHPISLVMSYDNATNLWQVSRRDADTGLFTGDVRIMTATRGYFVFTNSLEPLKILRPGLATAAAAPAVPPAVTIRTGWNLVPVLSNEVPLPKGVVADTYFGTLATSTGNNAWLKALSWRTATQTWTSTSPGQVDFTSSAAFLTESFTDRCGTTKAVGAYTAAAQTTKAPVCIGEGVWLWSTIDGIIIP